MLTLLLALMACDRTEKDTDSYIPPDNNTDDSSATDDSGKESDPPVGDYLEVAALGFEFTGIWNQDLHFLDNYIYEDSNGDLQATIPYVLVTLASLDYFSMTSDDPGFEDEYCEYVAIFRWQEADFKGQEFDWDAGKGGTGLELETWDAYEGYLEVLPDTYSDRCYELDPAVFEGGDPLVVMDGMHFGLGFGPLSDHLYDIYKEGDTFADYELAYMTQYIAINHPDGSGGYTFDAYDWNGGLYIETDFGACVDVDDGAGGTFEVCGQPQVDADSYYVPGDTTIEPRYNFVRGFSAWLEDTPNLDLSILKEGVPQ